MIGWLLWYRRLVTTPETKRGRVHLHQRLWNHVPSASALIVLLAAVSLQRVGLGLLVILAFSSGMASVLDGVGLPLVYARRWVESFEGERPIIGTLARLASIATVLAVLASGFFTLARGLVGIGLV